MSPSPELAADVFLRQLAATGTTTIFGNPGTFEQQLLDALPRHPDIHYAMCLHESIAIGMGIGHARATKKPAFVQLHASVGLGNAAGLLFEAKQSHVPMVVYVGENRQADEPFGGFLAADITALATPWCKHVERITDAAQLTHQLRRAFEIATTAPCGPVVLTIPMDVMETSIAPDIQPLNLPKPASNIDAARIAETLLSAKNPMLLVGDGVGWAAAQDEVRELSHRLDAPVYGIAWTLCNAHMNDPLFQEMLWHVDGNATAAVLRQADVLLAVGVPLAWEIFPTHEPYLAKDATLIHLDSHGEDIGRNIPAAISHIGDIKDALQKIIKAMPQKSPDASHWPKHKAQQRRAREAAWDAEIQKSKNHPALMMKTLCEALPEDVLVCEEAMTAQPYLQHYLKHGNGAQYFPCLSRALGAGWPSATAMKLAFPARPVAAISADGAAMYVPQALWTAAHLNLNMVFIVLNNRSYKVLKHNLDMFRTRLHMKSETYPHMDLTEPALDFVALARSMGVDAVVADTPDAVRNAVKKAFADNALRLIDIRTDGRMKY